jgi:hypothetical protein
MVGIPRTVSVGLIEPTNRVMMSVRECSILVGSVAAGSLIALLSNTSGGATHGLALAFGFDAFSFAFSSWTMSRIEATGRQCFTPPARTIFAEIVEAMGRLWADVTLRSVCFYLAAINFSVVGPIEVAVR